MSDPGKGSRGGIQVSHATAREQGFPGSHFLGSCQCFTDVSTAPLQCSLKYRLGFGKGLTGDETTQHRPGLEATFPLLKTAQLLCVLQPPSAKPRTPLPTPSLLTQLPSPGAVTVCVCTVLLWQKCPIFGKTGSRSQTPVEIGYGLFPHTLGKHKPALAGRAETLLPHL